MLLFIYFRAKRQALFCSPSLCITDWECWLYKYVVRWRKWS